MAFTLRVTFHGVIMFVERPKGKRVTMLLCRLDFIEHGKSYVRFDNRNYNSSSNPRGVDGRPPKRYRQGRHDPRRHIELKDERLSIKATVAPEDRKLEINRKADRFSSTPTAYDAESLRWLTHLEDLAPKHGKVKPGYFAIPPTATPRLTARFDFSQGRLRTNGAERVQVPFKNKGGRAERRAMARELVLEMTIDDDHFVLRSEPLAGSAHNQEKDMRFDANGADMIDIHIGNEAYRDIYWETPPITPIDVIQENAAKEYKFYCQLCADRPSDPKLPIVAARPSGGTFCSVTGGG